MDIKLNKIKNEIAVRILYSVDGKKKVKVILGKPGRLPKSSLYYCPYQIKGIGDECVRWAAGIDAICSIQFAIDMIGSELYTTKEAKTGRLRWKAGRGRDLGFPTLKDLSVKEALLKKQLKKRDISHFPHFVRELLKKDKRK